MSTQFLRILAQRRQASVLSAEAPARVELEDIIAAAVGHVGPESPLTWRLVGTTRAQAPDLAAALSGLKNIPDFTENTARLKGKNMRRLAAFRGSLAFASNGGLALALVFQPQQDSELPKRIQRGEALGARHLLEAAFYATGWATQWSPRQSPDPEFLGEFYGLAPREEVLGWLFVGRPERSQSQTTATLPGGPLPLTFR
ncbi:hypothetical protein [Kocuria sp.]|uniref:hypothetical protein n=1 Tax=Kocuria sp. TaxID=1871328 RepID=UPI0026E078BC|nr:hypothetical protein [Kocuria sp.]MDO5617529.1 hypothetical protein [Kocuria sp.]